MPKHVVAFFLGLLSFLVLMFVGETYGDPKAAAVAVVYFFACQFFLSLGNKAAHRHWSLMLTLNAITILATVIMVMFERGSTIVSGVPVFLIIPCAATYLGAVMASVLAKQKNRSPAIIVTIIVGIIAAFIIVMEVGENTAILVGISGCTDRRTPETLPEFPFPMSFPSSVSVIGDVRHEFNGQFEVGLKDSKKVVSGERWTGHVRVEGFEERDPHYLELLERSLVEGTGWESIFRDESREPPIAVLHRSRGREYFWITFEGWPEDVTVTSVHQK